MNGNRFQLTILMPCLNESETIGSCITRARKLLNDHSILGEILIADNGSTDGSQRIAADLGARVVNCPVKGYGAALQCGIERARGEYILMGDSDDSYHFDEAFPMIEQLMKGADVCMGTRLKGHIMPGAMPKLNRFLGNPVLTFIGRLFFHLCTSDFHCGLRGFRKDKILSIGLVTTGMEWASEMVIKAGLAGLKITEVPTTLYRDGRSRPPHLRRWQDGWRHLRFMLLHCPSWLFIYPGVLFLATSLIMGTLLIRGPIVIGRANLDVHTLLVMSFLLFLGIQILFTGLLATLYGLISGVLPHDEKFYRLVQQFSLEKLLVGSIAIGTIGLGIFLHTFMTWYKTGFANLDYTVTMRQVIPALSLITVSIQGMFNGFMLSVMFLKTSKTSNVETIMSSPVIGDRKYALDRIVALKGNRG